jgi:hypothetical protein
LFVTAKTVWVWTEQGADKHPNRIAGAPIGDAYRFKAPAHMLHSGDICDREDYEGQTDLFQLL